MMKTFRSHLTELVGTSHQDMAADKNINTRALGEPEVLKKINAWVGQIAGSYTMPEQAVHQLRSSLLKIGLTFDEVNMTGDSGSVELPLTLHGGRFGKDVDTPHDEFMNDDGISNQVDGGLALRIDYKMNEEDHSCRLSASIG